MKKSTLVLMLTIFLAGCTAKKERSPIEGAWQLVYADWPGYLKETFPSQKGSDLKIWSDGHFTFVGHFKPDTTSFDIYGGGTYKLDGNKYEENIVYHVDQQMIGSKPKMLLEIRNDTLIQRYTTNDNWELTGEYYTEKYVRLN